MLKTKFTHSFYLCTSFLLISTSFTASTVSSDANTFLKDEELTESHFSGTRNDEGGNIGRSLDFYHADKTAKYHSIASEIKLNRKGMQFVKRYIKNSSESLVSIRKRSMIPFFIIDSVFSRYGLPVELKYLAVIESELKPSAISQVGALGPWQLMPATARDLGLKITKQTDERRDYYKSTSAAAKYLRDLYAQFDDWLLVLAAYNGGPKPVYTAMRESGSKNFWALQDYLPAESREHVKKFIATHYYFEGHGSETTSTRAENQAHEKTVNGIAKSKPASAFSQNKKVKPKPIIPAHKSTNLAIHHNLKQNIGSENSSRKNQNIAGQFETSEQRFRRVMRQSEESLKKSRKII
jgi:hypothetical protein